MATIINTTITILNSPEDVIKSIVDECSQYLNYEVKAEDQNITLSLKQSFNETYHMEAFLMKLYKETEKDFNYKCNFYWNTDGTPKSESIHFLNIDGNKNITESRELEYLDDFETKQFNYELENNVLKLTDYDISITFNDFGEIMPGQQWLELSRMIGEEKTDEVHHIIENYREKNHEKLGFSNENIKSTLPLREMDLPF